MFVGARCVGRGLRARRRRARTRLRRGTPSLVNIEISSISDGTTYPV